MNRDDYPGAQSFLPKEQDLDHLAEAASKCQGCPLYRDAKQVVFGEGSPDAPIVLVGEQPGTQEDRLGEPFVGPGGRVLDHALEEAGLPRETIYLTNAVKHFKFTDDGNRKKAIKPALKEIQACRPWLREELAAVDPEIVIALGAVPARSLLDQPVAVREMLGSWLKTFDNRDLIVTYHPSAALRVPLEADQDRIFDTLVEDLVRARRALSIEPPRPRPGA